MFTLFEGYDRKVKKKTVLLVVQIFSPTREYRFFLLVDGSYSSY